jgi:hypothetical protein
MSNSVTKNDKTRRSSVLKDLYAESSKSSLIKTAFKNIAEKLRGEGRAPKNLEEYLVGPVIGINIYPGSSIESIVDIDGDVTDYYVQTAVQWWDYYMPGQDSPSRAQFRDELQRIYNDYIGGHKFSYPDPVKEYKPYVAPVAPAPVPAPVMTPPAPPTATAPTTTQIPPPIKVETPPIGEDEIITEKPSIEEITTIDSPTSGDLGGDITSKDPFSEEVKVISGPGGDLDDGDFDSEESNDQDNLYKIDEDGFTLENAADASSDIKAIYKDIFEMIYLEQIKEVEDKEELLLTIKSSSKYLEDMIIEYHKALPPVLAGYFEIFANNCIGSSSYIYNKLVNPGGDLKAKQKYISAIGEVLDGRDHFSNSFYDMVDDLSAELSKDNMLTLQYLSELMVDFINNYLADQSIKIDLKSALNTVTKVVVSRSFCLDITDDILDELLSPSGSDFKITAYNEKQITFKFGHFELGRNNSKFAVKSETISFNVVKELVQEIIKNYDEEYVTDAIDEAKLKYKDLFNPRAPEGDDDIEVLSTIVFNEIFYVLNAKPVELGREVSQAAEESSEEITTTDPSGSEESSEDTTTTEPSGAGDSSKDTTTTEPSGAEESSEDTTTTEPSGAGDSSKVVEEEKEEEVLSNAEVTEEELIKSLETEYNLEEAAYQAMFHLFTGKDHFSAQEVDLAKKLLERGGVLEGFIDKLHPSFPNNPAIWVISDINEDRPGVNNTDPNNDKSHKNLDIREGDNRQKLINALSASDKVEVTVEGSTVFVNVTSDEKKKRLRSWVSDQIRKAGYKSSEFSQVLVDHMILTAKEGAIDAYVKSNIKSIFDKEGNLKDGGPKIISGIPYYNLLENVGKKSVKVTITDKDGTRSFDTKNINLVAKKDGKSFDEDFFQLFKNSAEIQGLVISEINDKNGKPVHFRYFRIGMDSINEEYCREYHKEFLESIDPMDKISNKDTSGKDKEAIEKEASDFLEDLKARASITSANRIQKALLSLHEKNPDKEAFSVASILYSVIRREKSLNEDPAELRNKVNFEALCLLFNAEILANLDYSSSGKTFNIVKHSDSPNPSNIKYKFENAKEVLDSLNQSKKDVGDGEIESLKKQLESNDFYSIIDIRFKVLNEKLLGAMRSLFNSKKEDYNIEKYIEVAGGLRTTAFRLLKASSLDNKVEAMNDIKRAFIQHISGLNNKGNNYFKKPRGNEDKEKLVEKFKFDLFNLDSVNNLKEDSLQQKASSILDTMGKEDYVLLVRENISKIITELGSEGGKKAATEIAKVMYETLGVISYVGYKKLVKLISKGSIEEIESLDSETLPIFSSILSTLDTEGYEGSGSAESTPGEFYFEDRFLNDVVYAANTLFINKGEELSLNGEVYDDFRFELNNDNSKLMLVLIGIDIEYSVKKEDMSALFDAAGDSLPQDMFNPSKYEEEAKSDSEMLSGEEVEYIFNSLKKAPVIEYDGESYYGIKSKPFGRVDLLGLTREVSEDAKEVLERDFFINPDVFIIKSKLDTLEGGSFNIEEMNNLEEDSVSVSTEDESKMDQNEYNRYKERFENLLKSTKDGALTKETIKKSLKSQNIFVIKNFLENAEEEDPELIELLKYLSDSPSGDEDDSESGDKDSVEVSEDDSVSGDKDSVEVSEDDSVSGDKDSVEVSEDDSVSGDKDSVEVSEDDSVSGDKDSVEVSEDDSVSGDKDSVEVSEDDSVSGDKDSVEVSEDDSVSGDKDDIEGEGSTDQNINEELDRLEIFKGSIQKLCFDFEVKDLFSEEAAKEIVKAKHEVIKALNDLGAKDVSSAVTIQSLINKTTDGKVSSAVKRALFHPNDSQLIKVMIEGMIISLVDNKGPYTNKRLYLNLKTTGDDSEPDSDSSEGGSTDLPEGDSETSSGQSPEKPLSSADEEREESSEASSSASENIYDKILKESGASSEIPSSLNNMETSGYLFPILDIVLMKSSDYKNILAEGALEGQEKGPLAMFISENSELISEEIRVNQNYLKDISKDLVNLAVMISNHDLNKDESGQPIFAKMSKGKGKPRISNIEGVMSALLFQEKKKNEITDFITDDGRDNTPDDYDQDDYLGEDLNDSDDSLVNEKDFEEKFNPLSDNDKEIVSDFIYRLALSREIFLPKEELVGQMDLSYYMIDQEAEYEKESDKDQELSKISDILRKMYKMDGFGYFEGDLSEKICNLRSTHKALQNEEDSETVCDKISSIISGMLVDELDLGSSSESEEDTVTSYITEKKTSDDYNQVELERLLSLEFEKFKDKDGKERAGFFKEAHPDFIYQSMIKSFIPDEYHVINKLELFDKKQTLTDRYHNILINLMNGIYPDFFKEVIQFIKATDASSKEIAESDEIKNIKSKMKSLNKDSEEYKVLKSNLDEVVFLIKSKQDICNESIIEIFENKIGFSKLNDALQALDQFPKNSIILRKGGGKNPVLGSFDEDLEYIKTAMSRPLRDGLNSHIFTAIGNYFFPKEPLRISYARSLAKGMVESKDKKSYKKNLKIAFEYLKNRDKIDYSDEKHRVKIDGIIESLSKYLNLRFGAVFSIEAESIYSKGEQEDLEDEELNASSYQNAAIMIQNKQGERDAEAKEEISSKPVDFIGIHNSLLKILYYKNTSDDNVLSEKISNFFIYYIYNNHKYKFNITLPSFYYDEDLSNGKGGVTSKPLNIGEDIRNLQVKLERQDIFEQGKSDSISYLREIYSNKKSDSTPSSFDEEKLNAIKALLSIGAETMGGSTKEVLGSYEKSSLNISNHSLVLYGKSEEFIYKTLKLEKSYDGYFVNMIGVRSPVAIIDESSSEIIELYSEEKDKEKYILDIESDSDIKTVEVISHKEVADIEDIKQLAGYENKKRRALNSLTNEEYNFFFTTNYIYNIVGDGDEIKGSKVLSKNSKAISDNNPDYVDFDILGKHLEAIESVKNLAFLNLDDFERKCFAKIVSKKKDHKYLFLKSMISEDILNSQFSPDFKPKEQKDGSIANTREKGMNYFGIKILGEFYQSKFIKDLTGDYADIILFDSEVDAMSQYMEYHKGGAKQFENIIINDETYKINEEADIDSKMNAALSYAMNMMNVAISYGKERSDISNKITNDFGRILKSLVCGYIMRNPNKKPPVIEWDLNIINNSFDSEDLNESLRSAYGNKSKTIKLGGLEVSFASAYIKSDIKKYIAEAIIENSIEKLMNVIISLSTLVIAEYRIKSRKVKQKDRNTFKKMIYPENPTISIPLFVSSEVVVEEGADLDEESLRMSEKEIENAMKHLVIANDRIDRRYLRRLPKSEETGEELELEIDEKIKIFERGFSNTFIQEFFDAFRRLSDYFKYTNSRDRLEDLYKNSDRLNKLYMELYGEEELTDIIGAKEVERLK